MRRMVLLTAACLSAAACSHDSTGPSDTPLAPVYLLTTVDGARLPCCSRVRTSTTTEKWETGRLSFTGPDAYTWTMQLGVDSAYTTTAVDTVISMGHYSRQGTFILLGGMLSFSDSATSRQFSAILTDSSLVVTDRGVTYRFVPQPLPTVDDSYWHQLPCNDAAGDNPGCPVTDDSGGVTRDIGGRLNLGRFISPGTYIWQTIYEYRHPTGRIDTTAVASSQGTYRVAGATVTLTDDSTGTTRTAEVTGDSLLIQAGARVFWFYRNP